MTTSMQSRTAACELDLHGLSLREAFFEVVLNAPEVIDLERELAGKLHRFTACLQDGRLPTWYTDYQWPLYLSADSLANEFISPRIFLENEPRPRPSNIEVRAAELLSNRLRLLVDLLARGEMIAIGTFWNSGLEQEIGARQWGRSNLAIDVQDSSLCVIGDVTPCWSAIWLKKHQAQGGAIAGSPTPDEPSEQNVSVAPAETACTRWLQTLMADPAIVPISKDELWRRAQAKWPGKLSRRGFNRSWDLALRELDGNPNSARWMLAGRRKKSP